MQLLAADDFTYNSHALKCLRDRTLYCHDAAYLADRWRGVGSAQSRRHNGLFRMEESWLYFESPILSLLDFKHHSA